VYDACAKPFYQILSNAGYSEAEASMIVMVDLKGIKDFWTGYNIKKCSTVNMKKDGIIDPYKVTKQALLNASSIAGTILLTEVIAVDIPEENTTQPQMDPSMMMGM
jgi:chaperonin GroEL